MRISAAASALPATSAAAAARAPAVAISAEAARATRRTTFALGPRFVDFQVPAVDFLAVQPGNRLSRLVVVRHLDECKTPRPAGLAVHRDMDPRDLAERLEERAQLALRRLETHVTHKKILYLFLSHCTSTAAIAERTRLRRSINRHASESAEISGGNARQMNPAWSSDNPAADTKIAQVGQKVSGCFLSPQMNGVCISRPGGRTDFGENEAKPIKRILYRLEIFISLIPGHLWRFLCVRCID